MDVKTGKDDRRIVSKMGNTIAAMARLFNKGIKKKFGTFVKDAVIIEGFVEITNGDTHIIAKNSVVDQGLISLVSWLTVESLTSQGHVPASGFGAVSNSSMRIGTDTVTSTTHGMTALQAAIGAGIGTAPNTQNRANSNPAAGQYQVTYTATWNAGTVSGTLGEVGLFLNIWTLAQGLQTGTATTPTTNTLFSRMASADTKFTSFAINTAVPLAISWIVRFTFAV